MILDLNVRLHYHLPRTTDLLLQIEAAETNGQTVNHTRIETSETAHFSRISGEDGIGERIWLSVGDDFSCDYAAQIEITRLGSDLTAFPAVSPHLLPSEIAHYLMPSRYCPSDEFHNFVMAEFGGLSGGALICALQQWVSEKINYAPGSSTAQTTALDSFVQRQGVCRDFAHLMIALARAAAIPARFASVYAPNVTPQDFHAVCELYLDGNWHLVDATGMATAQDIAIIGVAPDAAGVAFMTTYGPATFKQQSVSVTLQSN